MDSTHLYDKTVLITGSTSGIGLGILKAFAQQGATVIMHGLEEYAEVADLHNEIRQQTSATIHYFRADVSQTEPIEQLFHALQQAELNVDILVNNAGIQHVAALESFPPEKWQQIIAINLSAAFHTSRLAIPHMKQAGWGRIINIASAHGLVASPFKSAYVAAKHGLLGLTKVTALELAEHNITCNAICPGYVQTPLVDNQIADTAKARNMSEAEVIDKVILRAQPSKKFTSVAAIGALCVFLCSEAANNMTGSSLPLDGGWLAQ